MGEKRKTSKTILLSGGGTGGSVTPLLAIAAELLKESEAPSLELVFVGGQTGPEKEMVAAFNAAMLGNTSVSGAEGFNVAQEKMKFIPLISGKFRRYFSFLNFWDIFKIIAAWFKSFSILAAEQPDIIISAGSFVSVPLIWAAAIKKIPVLIHQQDVRPGLANKLMAPFARVITVTFEKSLADYRSKAVWIGNPIKNLGKYQERGAAIRNKYQLNPEQSFVLVIGGGTGAAAINELIFKAAPELVGWCQIIHLAGKGKSLNQTVASNNYRTIEFLSNEEVLSLMAVADLVISRCGLGVLTELATLSKPAILVPMPASHQEDNAAVFTHANAAVVLNQQQLTPEKLVSEIKRVLNNETLREKLKNNISKVIKRGAAEKLAGIVWEMIK